MSSWLPPGWRVEAEVEPGGRLVIWAKRGLGRPIVGEQTGCGVGQTQCFPLREILRHVTGSYLETCIRAWAYHAELAAAEAQAEGEAR